MAVYNPYVAAATTLGVVGFAMIYFGRKLWSPIRIVAAEAGVMVWSLAAIIFVSNFLTTAEVVSLPTMTLQENGNGPRTVKVITHSNGYWYLLEPQSGDQPNSKFVTVPDANIRTLESN